MDGTCIQSLCSGLAYSCSTCIQSDPSNRMVSHGASIQLQWAATRHEGSADAAHCLHCPRSDGLRSQCRRSTRRSRKASTNATPDFTPSAVRQRSGSRGSLLRPQISAMATLSSLVARRSSLVARLTLETRWGSCGSLLIRGRSFTASQLISMADSRGHFFRWINEAIWSPGRTTIQRHHWQPWGWLRRCRWTLIYTFIYNPNHSHRATLCYVQSQSADRQPGGQTQA